MWTRLCFTFFSVALFTTPYLTLCQRVKAYLCELYKENIFILFIHFLIFCWDWGLNSGLHTCKAGTLSLEPHLQPYIHIIWQLLCQKPLVT
jgi:hypothetical protein